MNRHAHVVPCRRFQENGTPRCAGGAEREREREGNEGGGSTPPLNCHTTSVTQTASLQPLQNVSCTVPHTHDIPEDPPRGRQSATSFHMKSQRLAGRRVRVCKSQGHPGQNNGMASHVTLLLLFPGPPLSLLHTRVSGLESLSDIGRL
ncbi:hypothetical protein E1301_Tti019255 [Triplophysa tibetana]|uniref:Uncharacterized protein n=1 Tax=Triplophysa tibetana TaxID=1572043 RepID=A0A5A9NL30_9TELE|nr:hypothetical protein E1301_Tti019255 [Triplophysa tibetana]